MNITLSTEIIKEKNSKETTSLIDTKKLLLTYRQCPVDINFCLASLKKILKKHNRNVTDYALSNEKHKDGLSNIHVYIELDK
jgi:hypothetical protein